MAVVFMDGFDYYESDGNSVTTEMRKHWSAIDTNHEIQARPGRANDLYPQNLSVKIGDGIFNGGGAKSILVGDLSTMIVGFAFQAVVSTMESINRLLFFYDSGTVQCSLQTNANAQLVLVNGSVGSVQATGTTQLRPSVWYHIQIRVTINDTTGSVHVKLNEQDEIHSGGGPVTGLDTQVSANATTNKIGFEASTGNSRFDDLWIINTTPSDSGPANDDFLGDIMIETLFADGNGATNDWTPLSGNNWENVDGFMDFDTSYVFTNTPSLIDLYTFDDLVQIADTGTISAIGVNPTWRKTVAGGRTVTTLIRSGGTNYEGETNFVADDYLQFSEIHSANPDTSAGWTISEINAAEFGVELAS